jgi:hypothetical protein
MRLFYLQNQQRIRQSVTDEFNTPPIGQTLSGQFNAPSICQTVADQLAIRQTASGELGSSPLRPFTLSWSHYVFLLGVKDPNERSF